MVSINLGILVDGGGSITDKLGESGENEKGYNLIGTLESLLTRICSILTTPFKHQNVSHCLNYAVSVLQVLQCV